MLKKLFLSLSAALFAIQSQAQVLLADTAFTTGPGYNGARASSVIKPRGTLFGCNMDNFERYKVADDFVVPAGEAWTVDTVILYGYVPGTSTTSTFSAVHLQITKDDVASTTVLVDNSVNRLVETGWTGIYRVDTANGGSTDSTRPIMYLKLKIPSMQMMPGTYWMAWSATGANGKMAFCPSKVLPDYTSPAGQHGLKGSLQTGWLLAKDDVTIDSTVQVGYNFILTGSKMPVSVNGVKRMDAQLKVVPNVVQNDAVISFKLDNASTTRLQILSADGRPVRTIMNEKLTAGNHQFLLAAGDLAAGIYFCVLQTDNGTQSVKMQVGK